MTFPIKIVFRGIAHSDALASYVRERAVKLARLSRRITSCTVALESPHRHRHTRHYRVRIDLLLPGAELVISRSADDHAATLDAYAAIDYAFDQAARRLEGHVQRRRNTRAVSLQFV